MENLDVWDYIVAFLFCFSLWMNFYGIKICREANKEGFNEKKLRGKVYGALAVSVVYALCRFGGM